jgi:hypothetical protein
LGRLEPQKTRFSRGLGCQEEGLARVAKRAAAYLALEAEKPE